MIMKHLFIVAISVFLLCGLGYFDTKSEFTEYSGIVLNFLLNPDGIMAKKVK